MSKDFWFPWYPAVYKANTMHLTAEQDGIYRRLIDYYMETREPLPDNEIALARIASVSEIKWLDASGIIRAFFTHKNGMLFHNFCDKMLDIQDKKAKRRTESAEKAAKKRWAKTKQKQEDECDTHNIRNAIDMRGDATETETETKKEKKNIQKKIKTQKAINRFEEFWNEYPRQRRGNKSKALKAYLRAIREERTNEAEIIHGVRVYAKSAEVAAGFAKGAEAWLNDDRWANDYTTKPNQTGGKTNGKFTAKDAQKSALKKLGYDTESLANNGNDQAMLCNPEYLRQDR